MLQTRKLIVFTICFFFFGTSNSLEWEELLPYGRDHGDNNLPMDTEDVSSQEVKLDIPVKFFGREYDAIFANENGLLSFLTEIPGYFNIQFPMEYPLIAALYSDVDARGGGAVWYRKTRTRSLIDNIGERISSAFRRSFQPRELFIATWDKVGGFEMQTDKVNTFQIIVASDENDSFILFFYPEDGIQWLRGQGKVRGVPDARGQAGIISGEGQFVELPFSGTDQVRHLDKWSNVNTPGVFIYRVGRLEISEEAESPEEYTNNLYQPETFRSCDAGGYTTCHSFATCSDFGSRFCCKCSASYVGNGKSCIQIGVPQRVIGRVNVNLNSIQVKDQDLHCYIVTEEGRSYTAFSRIDPTLGNDLRSLSVIGTPVGWLFAESIDGAHNGFSYSGGTFNYTAKVSFLQSGHEARIQFNYKGFDVFDYINADVNVEGTVPRIGPIGVKIIIEDFDEKFTKVRPGLITASSKRQVILESGTRQTIDMEVEQSITFNECEESDGSRILRLKSLRNFVVFDEENGVVRFASTNKVTPFDPHGEDACTDMNCGENGRCEIRGSIGVCSCNHGYELYEGQCIDINECLRDGMSNCSPHAECINDPGSYGCVCLPGFLGNGELCFQETTCEELNCGVNSECISDDYGIPKCQCINGFNGNGSHCFIVPSEVELRGYASPESIVFDPDFGTNEINVIEDMGPHILHFYEVLNLGPHTIGDLKIRVTWPLKDLNDKYILYLASPPFIKYSTLGEDYIDQCSIDSSIINPEGLEFATRRVKREEEHPVYDNLNDFDRRLLMQYEQDYSEIGDYDYSHFDIYNDPKNSYTLNPSNADDNMDDTDFRKNEYNYIDLKDKEMNQNRDYADKNNPYDGANQRNQDGRYADYEPYDDKSHYSVNNGESSQQDFNYFNQEHASEVPEEKSSRINRKQNRHNDQFEGQHYPDHLGQNAQYKYPDHEYNRQEYTDDSQRNYPDHQIHSSDPNYERSQPYPDHKNVQQYPNSRNEQKYHDHNYEKEKDDRSRQNQREYPDYRRQEYSDLEQGNMNRGVSVNDHHNVEDQKRRTDQEENTEYYSRQRNNQNIDDRDPLSTDQITNQDDNHKKEKQLIDESPRRQGGPGQVSFTCTINLAVNEIASLTIKSYLNAKTLRDHYPRVTQFVFPSEGEIELRPDVKSKGSNLVNLITVGVPKVKYQAGKDHICGEIQCDKNADCYQMFRGNEAAQCRCRTGYKGDGFDCEVSDKKDCRVEPGICHDFAHCEYDTDNQYYRCECLSGYEGNGTDCTRVRGSCHVLNDCSPNADCIQNGEDYVCQCHEGYHGDGYECRRISEESWVDASKVNQTAEMPACIFDICTCHPGYLYEGSRCIYDEYRRELTVPAALGHCYGTSCECPTGYKYDNYDQICKLSEINFPATDVFCDDDGVQCGRNAECVYDRYHDHSICNCKSGYIGDGFYCEPMAFHIYPGKCIKHSDCPIDMKCVLETENFNFKFVCVDESPVRPDGTAVYTTTTTTTTPFPVSSDSQEETKNEDLCTREYDCHANADCVFNSEYERYQCQCNEFYLGDGKYDCVPSPNAGCDILQNCDNQKGECVYDEGKFVCRCKSGYNGDGITCRESIIGCNVINNCGEFATCQFDYEEGGYRCKCDEHRGFVGDGMICSARASCREIPSVCHAQAECIRNTFNDEYNCQCREGYIGDGLHCKEIIKHDGNFLLLAHGMSIIKLPFNMASTSPALPVFIRAQEMATGIDVDCITGKIYWTDTVGKRIRRSNYDGSQVETFLEGDMGFPVGIAIDWKSRNAYWTDSGKRTVNIVNLENKVRRILIDEYLQKPRGIAVHPSIGTLIWTDWDKKHPKIESANLDGTDRRTLVENDIGMPNSLVVNFENYSFCWTDGGSSLSVINPKIECMGVQGQRRQTIKEFTVGNSLPYGIALHENKIYWTDWKVPNVHFMNENDPSNSSSLSHVFAGMGKSFGIVSIPEECPYATSSCNPGACPDDRICAPNGRGGISCLCADGSADCPIQPSY